MKKLAQLLALYLMLFSFTACDILPFNDNSQVTNEDFNYTLSTGVSLSVVTPYGIGDGNHANYKNAYNAFESATGNTIRDASSISNEEWKLKIITDFEAGAEPDVLLYFNGADANEIVRNNKVVSLEEIKESYPLYADNMNPDLIPISCYDSEAYSVPVNGYWEALYVNKAVLAQAGVEIPGTGYTWEQFLADCQKIKDAGFTPIAVSLQEVPHYWFEFAVFNRTNLENHVNVPRSSVDSTGQLWVGALKDIKHLYDRGYLPVNTLTAQDSETIQLLVDNKAAFAIDGSWKLGWFAENADTENLMVTHVPSSGQRSTTETVGGLSMGYYITRKAWENEDKRETAVQFITYMTSDDVISSFSSFEMTALKNDVTTKDSTDPLILSAKKMLGEVTAYTPATQDGLTLSARTALFEDVKSVMTGALSPEDAVENAAAYNAS